LSTLATFIYDVRIESLLLGRIQLRLYLNLNRTIIGMKDVGQSPDIEGRRLNQTIIGMKEKGVGRGFVQPHPQFEWNHYRNESSLCCVGSVQ